jgi:hypothetical protein
MVARILGRLLHMVGILPTDKVTEVQRTDLVGEFVGHTGPKTRRKVRHWAFSIYILRISLSLSLSPSLFPAKTSLNMLLSQTNNRTLCTD